MFVLHSPTIQLQRGPLGEVFIWSAFRPTRPILAMWKGPHTFQFPTANDNEEVDN